MITLLSKVRARRGEREGEVGQVVVAGLRCCQAEQDRQFRVRFDTGSPLWYPESALEEVNQPEQFDQLARKSYTHQRY